jgi:hypothetical protein
LPIRSDGAHDDAEFLRLLARIDSNGNYTPVDLHVVRRFARRQKSIDDDETFRRLMSLICSE